MARQVDDGEQEVADLGRRIGASPLSSSASISSASSRIFASTARGSFQSKPTWPAFCCSLRARVRAGQPDRHAGEGACRLVTAPLAPLGLLLAP